MTSGRLRQLVADLRADRDDLDRILTALEGLAQRLDAPGGHGP